MTVTLAYAMALLAAQSAIGAADGATPLPQPEVEVAPLDPVLPRYTSCAARLSGERRGSVTAILPDLFARWTRGFAQHQRRAKIRSAPPYGPPQGKLSASLAAFLNGEQSFALVSRELTGEDQASYLRSHGEPPLVIPVAAGSWRHFGFVDTVVVIVNARNPLKALSFEQLDALLSARGFAAHPQPFTWGDMGASEWSGQPIHIYGAARWSEEDSARSVIVHQRVLKGGVWRRDLDATGSEADAPARVAADPQGLAITGLGHLPDGTRAVALSLEPGGPALAPTREAVVLNRYPLSRTVDLLVPRHRDGSIDPALAEFARYLLSSEGQAVVAGQGILLPLRAAQAARSRALLGPCRPG